MSKIRIRRLERAEPSGWWLAFAPGSSDFGISVALVRALPEWHRRWSAARRAWWVSDRGLRAVAQYLPALSTRLASERSGQPSSGELGPRWQYGPARDCAYMPRLRSSLPPPAAAFVEAHLLPGALADPVEKAKRFAAQRLHPDAGGEHLRMVAPNAAAKQPLLWAEKHDAGAA